MMLTRREFGKMVAMMASMASTEPLGRCSNLSPVAAFSTGGHTVYQLCPAKVDQMGVAELRPPENGKTYWDFSLMDQLTEDFMQATEGHPVVVDFSTIANANSRR